MADFEKEFADLLGDDISDVVEDGNNIFDEPEASTEETFGGIQNTLGGEFDMTSGTKTDVDLVLCIDVTISMKPIIDTVKGMALSLYNDMVAALAKKRKKVNEFPDTFSEEVMAEVEQIPGHVSEEEIEKYQTDLKKLLNEVEKINQVEGYDDEILINSWHNETELRKDDVGEMLDPKEVLKNAPRHSGNYISIPVVIGEKEDV